MSSEYDETRESGEPDPVPLGVVVAEADTGRLFFCNQTARRLMERLAAQPDGAGRLADLVRQGPLGTVEIRLGDEVLEAPTAPVQDESGRLLGMLAVLFRPQQDTPYRALAESATDGIVMMDHRGVIGYANPALCRLFGYERGELEGRPLTELMPERLRHAHAAGLARYQQTGRKHLDWERIELTGLHRDGHEMPVEVSISEFTREGERYFVGFLRDITSRRRMEESLLKTRMALHRSELAKRRFYAEVIRAVTRDRLILSDAIEPPSEVPPSLQIDLSGLDAYSELRERLAEVARGAGMSESDTADLVLATAEAASNAIKHAGGGMATVYVTPEAVVVRIADRGSGIRPENLPATLLVPGFSTAVSLGMGYTMMLNLCDHVRLSTGPHGTVVQLDRWIDPARRAQAPWDEVLERFSNT